MSSIRIRANTFGHYNVILPCSLTVPALETTHPCSVLMHRGAIRSSSIPCSIDGTVDMFERCGLIGLLQRGGELQVWVAMLPGSSLPIGQSDLIRLVFEVFELVGHSAMVVLARAPAQREGIARRT